MPSTDWSEVIPDDEPARFERHAELLGKRQQEQAKGATLGRALHAKGNLGVEAELEILDGIPAETRVGMFATPRTYRALARFSNGAPGRQSDKKLDVRGLAIKVFGVEGKKLIPGMEDETTQDFLAIRTPVLPIKDAEEFMTIVRVGKPPALMPVRMLTSLGLRRGVAVIRSALRGLKLPQSPLAATSYYSALPIKYGPYAVQYAFAAQEPPAPIRIATPDDLGDGLAARLRTAPVVYDFQIRFFTDAAATPIEDASVEWNSPWATVGKLTLPVQDPASPRGRRVAELVETLSFDPWHAREDLRPLGNIMRARNVAYRTSTKARGAVPEPREAPRFE